jgi:hypothetical protein
MTTKYTKVYQMVIKDIKNAFQGLPKYTNLGVLV